jgi:ubiquinone/menaquinone biosynthesis C-methylase UbiE
MLRSLFGERSRKELVTAQYGTALAASDYARAIDESGPRSRYYKSRLRLIQDLLTAHPGGDLLDAGCGPGVMVRTLLASRPRDFRITALDQSPAMVAHCLTSAREAGGEICPAVGQLEAMPLADASFDVTLVMGALEYVNARAALNEIARVTRPGGLAIVTMLNPLSPYRLTEWFLYWPMLRVRDAVRKPPGTPGNCRYGVRASGIRAFPPGRLQQLMRQASLQPSDLIHFDVTPFLPPLDALPRMVAMAEQTAHERTVSRSWRRWLGTAYLVAARRL